jgi:CSLREA domain-containing protein
MNRAVKCRSSKKLLISFEKNLKRDLPMKTRLFPLLASFALIVSLLPPVAVSHAAALTVTSLADNTTADGQCTLREAITNANNNAATYADCPAGSGADTISFDLSGVITVNSNLPVVTDAAGLTIDGAGQSVTISGNHLSRVILVQVGKSLTMNHLTIADGHTDTHGGGISNSGALTINDCVLSGNIAYFYGGGIINGGTLTIINSAFTSNTADKGGGIYNDSGTLTITNTTFSSNTTSSGRGGGIYAFTGTITITGSAFSGNSANLGSGGAIYNDVGTMTITSSIFSGNTANYGNGGAIYNNYSITMRLSTLTNNSAGYGGGIYNSGAYLTVANSTFSGNSASESGLNGGGLLNVDHSGATLLNNTFSGNSAAESGGSVGNASGMVTLRNTILANSLSGGNCAGTITNGGSNLEDGATCGWGSTFGSMSSTNPLLGALTGSPAYFPLNGGSPAIEKGDDPTCAAYPVEGQSQNSLLRPQGAHCDIGSVEVEFLPVFLPLIRKN